MAESNTATNTAGQDQEQDRRVKRQRMIDDYGFDPYGQTQAGLVSLEDALNSYDEVADESYKADKENDERPIVKVAGRIVLHRGMGNLVFATLRDHTGDLQVAVSKKAVDQPAFKLASKLVDLGDIVVVEGALGKTKTGEITVWAEGDGAFKIACKSLVPPPSKHQGLQDTELRYRQRYIDLWSNPEVMQTFKLRSQIIQRIREMLTDEEATLFDPFIEVETPMMQAIAGGAAARPFITHHNALDLELYLRIAPELYLKRLLVGGLPRVFEINRNFRNEGISPKHNPEFTMLELYQAFGSYNSMMDISEYLIRTLATEIKEDGVLPFNEFEIDYSKPFARKKYLDLFEEVNGFSGNDHDKLVAKAKELHIDAAEAKDHDVLLNDVWEETVEQTLIQPTFVIDYPASLCPLTKCKVDEPGIAERFELFVAKMELANAYTELNDPDVQEENFKQQLDGQKEEDSMAKMDQDFVDALKVGMPPAGGLGIGIDRLVMLLTGSSSIRDVIFFPLMRPRTQASEEAAE